MLIANVAFWPCWTVAVGYLAARTPDSRFANDDLITRLRAREIDGDWYEGRLRIQAWKDKLPEAAGTFAGSSEKVAARDPGQLDRFALETRRAEHAHWGMLAGAFVTAIWNPKWAFPINLVAGSVASLPFVAVQRYNRARIEKLRSRLRVTSSR